MIYSFENINKKQVTMKLIKAVGAFFMLALFLIPNKVSATHIVGGEMTYRCIASWTFEVTLKVRRDCEFGADEAQFDSHASVGIFEKSGEFLPWLGTGGQLLIPFTSDDTLHTDLEAGCDFLGDPVCVHETVYIDTITLPFRPGGYILAYQRCCRNETLTNILDPTDTGSTYSVNITNAASIECNNSPTFDESPQIYVCADEELVADMSATDVDGDVLVYSLFTPHTGASIDFPFPQPPKQPLFDEVTWAGGFSVENMMGGVPLTIDPNTGIVTGTPNLVGQFLVGVRVDEYRDGEIISTIKRDFEYNVRECIDGPEASFTTENDPECDGYEVEFTNTSFETDTYEWYFDFPNEDPAFKSTEENPTFIFPGDGIYTIKLLATRSADGCDDEFIKELGVYDSQLIADFDADFIVNECLDDAIDITLVSTSTDSGYTIESFEWTLTSETLDTSFSGESISVVLPTEDAISVTLVVTSSNGCSESITQNINTNDNGIDPSFEIVSINECGMDSLNITLMSTTTTSSPEATIDEILWTISDEVFTYNATGDKVTTTLPRSNELVVNMTVTLSNGCVGTATLFLDTEPIDDEDIEFVGDTLFICPGDTVKLLKSPNADLVYTWTPMEGLIFEGEDTSDPSFAFAEGQTEAVFNVVASDTICSRDGGDIVILLNTREIPDPFDFTSELDCGTFTVCFENISLPQDGLYIFDFGDESTDVDTSTATSICYTYPDFGVYNVTLEYTGACEEFIFEKEVAVTPDLTISAPDTMVVCMDVENILTVDTDSDGVTFIWTNEAGEEIGEGSEITYVPTGDEVVTVIGTNAGGCMDTAMIQLIEYAFDYTVNAPEVACISVDTDLSITNNSGDNLSYVWDPSGSIVGSNEGSDVVINISQDTEFTVTVTNEDNGCSMTETISIPVSDVSVEIVSDPEEVFQCNPAEISVANDEPGYTYVWNTGDTGPSFTSDTLLETTTFSVTVTDEFGCTAEATRAVTVLLPQCDETDVFLPTAFTPNGDNINDILKVESNFVKSMQLKIYDRWGIEIFVSTNVDDGWDGTFNGADLAPDVYAYIFNATCSDGTPYSSIGNITLIR